MSDTTNVARPATHTQAQATPSPAPMDALASLQAELAKLKAENAMLTTLASKPKAVSFKVSEKGALSMYGLGRFPVTLYKSQWEKLVEAVDSIKAALKANEGKLAVKGE